MSNQITKTHRLFLVSFLTLIFYFLFIGSDCYNSSNEDASEDFNLSISTNSIDIKQGMSGEILVTLRPSDDVYTGSPVTLQLLGSDKVPELTYYFDNNPLSPTSESHLILSIGQNTPIGTYDLGVFARQVSGKNIERSENFTLNVISNTTNPDFSFSVSNSNVTIEQGEYCMDMINITRLNNFTDPVSLTIEGSIIGQASTKIDSTFDPNPALGNSSMLTLNAGNTVPEGDYSLILKGSSGSLIRTDTVKVSITASTALWKSQILPGTAWPLNSVHFTDVDHGFAVGEFGTILKTTNGGSDWIQLLNANTSAFLYGVQFIDVIRGYVVGESTFLYTSDAGVSWINRPPYGVNADINGLYFLNSVKGWLVGSVIRYTEDGGVSWSIQLGSEPGRNWTKTSFVNDTIGVVVGYKYGVGRQIRYTTDGGTNWAESTFPAANQVIKSVCFSNPSTVFAISENKILKSTDGGKNWTELSTSITEVLYGISFGDGNNGWVVGFEKSYRTTDGGNTWTDEFIATGVNFYDVYFVNSNTGYAVGSLGGGSAIYRRK